VKEADESVRLPLTQKDLAQLIGASREAVAEQIAEFKRAGLLKTSYRSLQLIDSKGLMRIISSDQEADLPEPLT
jgi:CRP-like cAMP-binding protein